MATLKLQRKVGDMLDSNFPQFRIRENFRPDWLISSDDTWLELDFYIEEIKVAIEVQGDQHFEFVPFFHGTEDNFKKRRKHDREKQNLCRGRRIKFYEICSEMDAVVVMKEIKERYCEQPKYFYQENDQWYKISKSRKKKERKVKKVPNQSIKKQKIKTKPVMLPGSHKMRNRARHILQCENTDGYMWNVWGGREAHQVKYVSNKIYECDCGPYMNHQTSICSHIIKVMMTVGDFPEPVLV